VETWGYKKDADSAVLLLDGALKELRSLVEGRVDKVEVSPRLVVVECVPLRFGSPTVRARVEEVIGGRGEEEFFSSTHKVRRCSGDLIFLRGEYGGVLLHIMSSNLLFYLRHYAAPVQQQQYEHFGAMVGQAGQLLLGKLSVDYGELGRAPFGGQ